MPKRKKPVVMPPEELEKMHTKALLAYLKRLHQCEESFEDSDMDTNLDLIDTEIIYFKKSEKWLNAYKNVKAILNNREHIEK